MDPRLVEAGRGVAWFSCGWQLFTRNPGTWVVLGVLLLVIALGLSYIPLGGLMLTLFMPAIAGGLLYGAAQQKAGRTLELGHVFQGFRDQARLKPLVVLGAVLLGASVISMMITVVFMADAMRAMMMNDPAIEMTRPGPGVLIALLLMLTVQLVAAALVYFAVPLVMLGGVSAGDAMQNSLRGCLRNILPLFVFSLIYLAAAVVASIPFGLGWIVLLPWSVGMYYCSYEDIYSAA